MVLLNLFLIISVERNSEMTVNEVIGSTESWLKKNDQFIAAMYLYERLLYIPPQVMEMQCLQQTNILLILHLD